MIIKNILSYCKPKYGIVLFSLLLIVHQSLAFKYFQERLFFRNRSLRLLEPGSNFADFKAHLNKVQRVGFLTDKDMSPEANDGIFLAAQCQLAPTALDLDNSDHVLIIIDPQNFLTGLELAQRAKLTPFYTNDSGKILAKKEIP